MEKENDSGIISENEFLKLLFLVQEQNDEIATLKLLDFYEQDIIRLSKFMRVPKEEAIQGMKVELIELFKKKYPSGEND
ncbi:hypothetical protein JI735_25830 [Paenibacillus sonchi]|uniref:Helix-turn-helix conjugative transposon-like domain-containing protein n=1 Tax=Paenibacillus sonchi TaxID=373687 RepID=A0A974PA43_9BACL|nr:hypothetical protein [Paenibacillus sonchi]QQZ59956.1 hypothetical protein JI735_25830 [Paenibacillus sonchi]